MRPAQLIQAIGWQKKALATNPNHPIYRQSLVIDQINLIRVATALGNDEEAAEAQRDLDELVASDPAQAAINARLAVVIGGEAPKDNAERLTLAQRAYDTKRFAAAAKLFAEALQSDPKLSEDRQAQVRYNAACCAALAASGAGKVDPPLDDVTNSTLRKQALDWLRVELAVWVELVESGPPETKVFITQTLEHWQQDSDLASIRDDEALAKLPTEEQEAFRQLWANVAELLKKSQN